MQACGGAQSMRKDRTRTRSSVERLRLAIDCLPVATREAMLRGIRANERIIVGAYVDQRGGVCPMLAAHRAGGRTDFLSFAKTWDRFTRAAGRSRPATERELAILVAQLEDSLLDSSELDFDRAIGEHRELRRRRAPARKRWREQAEPLGEIVATRLRRPPGRDVLRGPRTRMPAGSPVRAGLHA
jgi:hypothetical protein